MEIREWYETGWRKAKYGSHVEEIDETDRSWRTNIISWPRILGMLLNVNANRTKLILTSLEKCSNHEFLLKQLKNWQGEKNLTQKLSRGPTTWKVMRKCAWKDILWAGKPKDRKVVQSLNCWLGWSSPQEGGTGISWGIVKSMLSDWRKMLVFGTNW